MSELSPVSLDTTAAIDIMFGRCRPDALLAFGSRRPLKSGEEAPHYLFTIPVRKREEWLPGIFQHQVEQTQYVLQNTLSTTALTRPLDAYLQAIETGRPLYFKASNRNVYELAALVVDLDVGRGADDLTAWDALAIVGNMTDAGDLPLPSLAALSGRGAYLWWSLTAEDGRPPRNTPDNRAQWGLVIGELVKRTRNLKADPNAKRLANWYKRPGTIDTKTGREVVYLTFGLNHPAAVPLYRLPEMMEFLELHHAPAEVAAPKAAELPAPKAAAAPRRAKPATSGNPSAPHQKRVEDLERLAQSRGGIQEGLRTFALLHYYQARRMYLSKAYQREGVGDAERRSRSVREAQRDTHGFNRAYCRPPKDDEEVSKVFSGLSGRGYRARGATVAEQLHVSREEAIALGLVSVVPAEVKQERAALQAAERARKADRRQRVEDLLSKGHGVNDTARRTGERPGFVSYRKGVMVREGRLTPQHDEQGNLLVDDRGETIWGSES